MSDQIYYHSFLNRDRLIHIVDADPATCEALSVLFRLEGFQTTFSLEAAHFIVSLERRRPDIVVLNLAVGDILPIPHPQHRPLEVAVEGTPLARAAVGANGSRLACVVVGTD